jgi:hypothetical protein
MGNIVAQYDPLANLYTKKDNYGPELIHPSMTDDKKK